MDRVVDLDHAVLDVLDPDEPGRDRLVDQWCAGPLTEGVGVGDPVGVDQVARGPQELDEGLVGHLHIEAGDLGHLLGEVTLGVDRIDQDSIPAALRA